MASIQKRGDAYQLRVKHRLLPRPFFHTFLTEQEAVSYGEQLEALLRRGIVPAELLTEPKAADDLLLTKVLSAYIEAAPALTDSDDKLLGVMIMDKPIIGLRLSAVTYRWVESYVAWLKSADVNLAPSSIRKRIGALGRVLDWRIKRTLEDGAAPLANVARLLPRGYSNYTRADTGVPRRDQQRDRRLTVAEAALIDAALAGVKREDRERPYTDDLAFPVLYQVIVDTGMRLFEAFRLRADSIDLARNIIHVDGSKGHRGYIKPRIVPIKPHLREILRAWCDGRVGLLFPYWDGAPESRPRASSKLSRRFANLFEYARVPDFTEHDLRHEATCRWFELRGPDGRWLFSDVEIARIMGWSDLRMAMRYASIRGEDLASRLG